MDKVIIPGRLDRQDLKHTAKIYRYPSGMMDIIASSSMDFSAPGWESADRWDTPSEPVKATKKTSPEDSLQRAMRRARAKVRRLALANDFRWFVTLTIDPQKVDSFSGPDVIRKLNAWCSNMVQRHGLKYILVPERHKSGRIHFHGFFNDCLAVADSGHVDKAGHKVYNLPQWSLGFTTAIELYGDYSRAVGYVSKYIGKQGEKPAGRWYYSGGALEEPAVSYADIGVQELIDDYDAFRLEVPGRTLAVVNGLYPDKYKKEDDS